MDDNQCDIVILISLIHRQGIGRELLKTMESIARQAGCNRIWLITTNNNRVAIAFYQAIGWIQVAIHQGAVRESRKIKPQIPLYDEGGIAIEDEIEFELREFYRSSVMRKFDTKRLPAVRDAVAPDGSSVRILLGLSGGGLAHFELAPGETSIPVAHRTVEEIWYFLSGRGEMWRKLDNYEEVVEVETGTCITIPLGTHFQFRSFEDEALTALGITMPPWPGEGEAYEVQGNSEWKATVGHES